MEHGVKAIAAGGRERRIGHWGHSRQRSGSTTRSVDLAAVVKKNFEPRERHSRNSREWTVDGSHQIWYTGARADGLRNYVKFAGPEFEGSKFWIFTSELNIYDFDPK